MIKKLHDHARSLMEDALEKWLCALRGQPYPTPSKVVLTRIVLVRERDQRNPNLAPLIRRHS